MEARAQSWIIVLLILPAMGAGARTKNFVVTASTPALAQEIASAAESMRRDLALEWLGHELPDWRAPCLVVAKVSARLGAGGRTSFSFRDRVPFDWDMEVQGSRERILDSVLPHEVTHTIFATHFGRPLPRWADEGACTTVEHASERRKQELWLVQFLKTERGIPFNHMFAMTEYPGDIMPLYSQGYSVARFLIAMGGKRTFIEFVGRGLDRGDWTKAVYEFYRFRSLGQLQIRWLDWVINGSKEPSPSVPREDDRLAAAETKIPLKVGAASRLSRTAVPKKAPPPNTDQLAFVSSDSTTARTHSERTNAPRDRSYYAR